MAPIASDMHSRAEDCSSNHGQSDPNHQRCSRRFSRASDMLSKRSLEAVRFLKVFWHRFVALPGLALGRLGHVLGGLGLVLGMSGFVRSRPSRARLGRSYGPVSRGPVEFEVVLDSVSARTWTGLVSCRRPWARGPWPSDPRLLWVTPPPPFPPWSGGTISQKNPS